MGLSFTSIHFIKSDPEINVDPDIQITDLIRMLEGQIKENWKVVAPTPNSRVIYFEMQDGMDKPEFVQGSAKDARKAMTGQKATSKRIKKRGNNE